MEGRVKISAELTNPTETWEDELPVTFPPEQSQAVCFKTLSALQASGGIVEILSDTKIKYIPMERIRSISLELSTVVGANLADLAQATTGRKPQ